MHHLQIVSFRLVFPSSGVIVCMVELNSYTEAQSIMILCETRLSQLQAGRKYSEGPRTGSVIGLYFCLQRGIGRKRKCSDTSDSNFVELMHATLTLILDFTS